jgi:hypothetical protein
MFKGIALSTRKARNTLAVLSVQADLAPVSLSSSASAQLALARAASAAVGAILAELPPVAPRSRMLPVAERPVILLEDSDQAV